MHRLLALLGRLLRYLSAFAGTSVKRLFALLHFIRWRTSIARPGSSDWSDDPPLPPPPESTLLRSNNEFVCPSHVPRAGHVTLNISHDQGDDRDEPYTTTVHSPSPTSILSGPTLESPSSRGHGQSHDSTIHSPTPTRLNIPGQSSLLPGPLSSPTITES